MEATIIPTTPEVKRWNKQLMVDNLGIIARKLEPVLRRKVLPQVKKDFRANKSIPTGLVNQELMYLERVLLARSQYKYSVLKESVRGFKNVPDMECWDNRIDQFTHPYKPSHSHNLDLSLERNRISLKRNGGAPTMQSKRDSLDGARQWNDSKVKTSSKLENCHSIVIGYRTQQPSAEGEVKVRVICMIPTHIWLLESEAADSAINETIANVNTKHSILVLYVDPSKIQEWMQGFASEVVCWLNVDSEKYDQSVTASEIRKMVEVFYPQYEFKDLLTEYLIYALIIAPEEVISRNGGEVSGSKTTNLFDGYSNINDLLEVLDKLGLLKYVVCILVNGDDITIGFSTQLEQKNLIKISDLSRRNINPDKSLISDHIWNSKWYVDEEIQTRPIFRVLNSLMYSERRKESIYGSKEMIEIANAMILKDVEDHPIGESLIKAVANVSKYHISSMSNEQLDEAVEYFIEDQAWRQITSKEDFFDSLRSTAYAQAKS